MKYKTYENLHINETFDLFEFISIGTRGIILKRIAFVPTEYADVYNLVLGDVDVNGEIDDNSISSNGDRNRILATVAYVIEDYLNKFPNRLIYFAGNTSVKSRLYRMAIGLNLEELSLKFDIYYQNDTGFHLFEKNKEVHAILVKIKS